MAITPRLELRQGQALVMTPQLQQAIKLLQMSSHELMAYVEQELVDNPLLERADGDGGDGGESVPDAPAADTETPEAASDEPLDIDPALAFDEEPGGAGLSDWPAARGGGDGGEAFADRLAERPKSLREHLAEQVAIDLKDSAERIIALALIDRLDDAGYLVPPLAKIAGELGAALDQVAAVLARLKRFDPPGLFAGSLKECLALQLAEKNRLDPAMQALVDNLELLARRDWASLKRLCAVDDADLKDMIAELKCLNPKPAEAFGAVAVDIPAPDILMRATRKGGWLIELNAASLPRVIVNNRYAVDLGAHAADKPAKEFIAEKMQSASWLVRALDQRAQTILKVATELVKQQERFFAEGVAGLRPLVLRDIATAIEMHESTVSRVTANKMIATPRGTFELKYFFTSSIASSGGGEAHSASAVKSRIKALIDAENPRAVLSDDTLVEMLRREGIEIARRTVAKYREALRIPSSVQRRLDKGFMPAA
ncbi:MAG: RNA polymerase sigma-54 factor [Alphaproteobacteria bacterium]|nr:RNA polymerase sigma-54 factor [Alphaproteobacteria bacterium]